MRSFNGVMRITGSAPKEFAKELRSMSSNQSDYNKLGLVTFTFTMVFTLLFFGWVVFISRGIDLGEVPDAQPGAEQQVAAVKKIDVSGVKDPWAETSDMVEHGHELFTQNCAMCHGQEGKGDGPAGASLNPKPRNMVEGKWTKGGDRLGLFHTITVGSPGTSMAPWGQLAVNDRWSLVHFVRSITKNKVKDDDAKVAAAAPKLK
jgi:mono/diheme cytochrome c family protein